MCVCVRTLSSSLGLTLLTDGDRSLQEMLFFSEIVGDRWKSRWIFLTTTNMCLYGSRVLFFWATRLFWAAEASTRKTRPHFSAPLRRILQTVLLLVHFSQADPYVFSLSSTPCTHTRTHTCTDFCPFQRLTLGNAVLLPYRRTDKAIVQIRRLRVHASTCMCACAGACLHFFSSWLPLMRSRWFRARRWSRQAGRVNVMSAAQM